MRYGHIVFFGTGLLLAGIALAHLRGLAGWLACDDELAPADAILVLDVPCREESLCRFSAGFNLLRRGYAPQLLVSQSIYGSAGPGAVEALPMVAQENIHWLHSAAVSTRQEAIAARQTLKQLRCARLLLVTSAYHARRAREIFTQELRPDGIEVRVFAVRLPGMDENSWWRTQDGRARVLTEAAKLLATKLRFDPPISNDLRHRIKIWAMNAIP